MTITRQRDLIALRGECERQYDYHIRAGHQETATMYRELAGVAHDALVRGERLIIGSGSREPSPIIKPCEQVQQLHNPHTHKPV